jgi:prevent-host-death family protein
MGTWQLQEARRRFGKVVDLAVAEGPQRVTRRGRRAVVIGCTMIESSRLMPKSQRERASF